MGDGLTRNTTIFISSRGHLNLSFNLLQCGITTVLSGGSMPLEPGNTFQLYYVNRGSMLLCCGEMSFKIPAGHGFFIFPDMDGTLRILGEEEEAEAVWVSFTGYQVETYLGRSAIFRSKPIFDDPKGELGELINGIHQASQNFPNRYCKMMSAMYNIFAYMLDAHPACQPDSCIDTSNYFAARAIEFVDAHYARNITVGDIAVALGITRKHLYEVFNLVFHIPPKQYLIYYRIEKACKRLKSTDQSVREIAETVGYANQFYFSKEFKRLIGMSPTEYRKAPDHSEIFSYRTFVSALTGKTQDISLPVIERLSATTYEPIP